MLWIFIVCALILIATMFALRVVSFRNWLIYAVSEAEKYLGSGTGKLKIRYAYDLALKKFPMLSKLMPWTLFSWLIDRALVVMWDMINTNSSISTFIKK